MTSKFVELAKAKARGNRNIIISKTIDGEIIIVQQLIADDNGRKIAIFMKGAIIVDIENIRGLRDALNEAIEKLEKDDKI